MTDEQTTEDTPQIDSIAATEIEEMDARKRLAALKLLQARLDAVSEKRKARGDYWRNILTELTQTLHDAIDATIPITDGQCRKNLVAIKAARAASEEAKASKAEEIADLKAAIKRIEETMGDLISKDPSNQMGLDLGGEQTTWLTKEVADQVNLALTAKESRAASDGEDMAADLVALRQQLDAMGISAIMPDDEADEAEEASASEGDATADEDDEGYEEDPTDFDDDDNVISLAGNA
jgi:HAMP domain-containing protein